MTVHFRRHTHVDARPADVFDLSLRVDVHEESFAESGERAVAGVQQGAMALGDTVTWRARHAGVWFTMTSAITELDRPACFVDEQVSGPFARFHHVHRFEPFPPGTAVDDAEATTMVDEIVFDAPLGVLGDVAERVWLGWYLPRLIDVRNVFIADAFVGTPAIVGSDSGSQDRP